MKDKRIQNFGAIWILGFILFFQGWTGSLTAQENAGEVCRIVDGKLVFTLDPRWSAAQRAKIAQQYDLDSTLVAEAFKGLPEVVVDNVKWTIRQVGQGLIELTKTSDQFIDLGKILEPVIMLSDRWLKNGMENFDDLAVYGVNRFSKPDVFNYSDSIATIVLPGYGYASSVYISGSFNNWSTNETPMSKTGKGWMIVLKLAPGHYPYKFIVDGRWTQDPNNKNREDDLRGGNNSVFYCYNYTFRLKGYTDARKVVLAASFNGFNPNELEMEGTDSGWILPIYLRPGTYSYKFIVDGRWMTDPENPVIRGDGRGNLNSFMGIGDSVLFRLKDHAGAGQVELAGSFNNWQWGELLMEKTAAGWELPIALGPGNHEYKYIVDGKWITDPGNPYLSGSGEYANSVLALKPTHSFTLNGYSNARKVIVCGSFNGWNEDGYRMAKTDGGWIFPIHLRPGKYTYKFILDGRWILDPGNDLWEENEYGTDNSVLWIK